jgi:formylglycine-generating enzyme required for sulfatase activity
MASLRLSWAISIFLLVAVVPAWGQPWDGGGIEGDPYLIEDACDMQAIGADSGYWNAHFKLTANINLSAYTGTQFNIIGNFTNRFTGSFDGNGHTISNFTYTSGVNYTGLFGYVGTGGKIKDLGLTNVNVDAGAGRFVGGLVGENWGTVSNSYATGSVSGYHHVGGLVGGNGGTVSNCHAIGNVTGTQNVGGLVGYNGYGTVSNCYANSAVSGNRSVGGLVGYAWNSTITNCCATGPVTGGYPIGGLVGYNVGTVSNCYVTGTVTGHSDAGGLVGENHSTVSNCYAAGSVSGGYSVGGLVGRNGGTETSPMVSNCYATGSVTGGYGSSSLGGLCGNNYGIISNCYATGSVTGGQYSSSLGGLVGSNQRGTISNRGGTISNCYAAASVTGEYNVGGLVGYHRTGAAYTNCFWDSDVNSGLTGVGNITDPPEVMGRTTAQMQTQNTFTDHGWDFVSIWGIDEGVSYPYLLWHPPVSCTDADDDGYAAEGGECGPVDCDDNNTAMNPGEDELCDGLDNDCDDVVDNGGDALCDDGLWCNGQETCGGTSGCQAGTPVNCSDDIGCTDDTCDEINDQCLYTPNDGYCAVDGWYDTGNIQWVSNDQCTEKEQKEQEYREHYCDVALDCQYTVTSAQWVDTGSTRPKPDGTACDDGDPLTVNDMCIDGVCSGQLDSDLDGILDDGDYSGVIGDNPCTGGETADCDDNCPYTDNPDQKDKHGDGVGDDCQHDFDGDGINDNEDNCPEIPNGPALGTCFNNITNKVGQTCLSNDDCPLDYACQMDQQNSDNGNSGDLKGDVCDLCPDDPCDVCASGGTAIGPSGGIVINGAGTASVDIPSGALTEETTISIIGETDYKNYAIGRSPDNLEIGYIYTFQPHGLTFDVPVTITLTYEQGNMKECKKVEQKLDIYYYDDTTGWEPQGATGDCDLNTLTLEVGHFSTYVVIAMRDSDNDEVLDLNDNCPLVYNPFQSDIDADDVGDLCDICPNDALDLCDPDGSAAQEIDPNEGGTIETPDGDLVIVIDPNDLDDGVTISVTQILPQDPNVDIMIGTNPGWGQAVAVYDLQPDGMIFDEPVTLTITADVTELNENQRDRLGLYLWEDPNFVLLETADCSIVQDPPGTFTKICTVELEHFSIYAVVLPMWWDTLAYGDLTSEGATDILDLLIMVRDWLQSESIADIAPPPDGDDTVDNWDFGIMSLHWLGHIPEGMVYIPGNEFEMGDHFAEGDDDELPVHAVLLDSFFMNKFEITNQQYCDYLNDANSLGQIKIVNGVVYAPSDGSNDYPYFSASSAPAGYPNDGEYSQIDYSGGVFSVRTKDGRDMSNDPAVCVSWYGSAAYCNWRSGQEGYENCYNLSTWECDFSKNGYRLPTEAEWEYAARGGLSGKRFPWADPNISHSQANYRSIGLVSYDISPTSGYHPDWNDGIKPYTSVVGSFSANAYGLYDMAGNVGEFCNDWYDSNYYSVSLYDNPKGPASGTDCVPRGGGWNYSASICRVACRNYGGYPDFRYGYVGFRIVLDLN